MLADDYCGYSVAVSAGRFAYACSGQDIKIGTRIIRDAGVVHVYKVSPAGAITYEANMTHSVGVAAYDRLGGTFDAMSMFGNTLVVGMSGYESSKLSHPQLLPHLESERLSPSIRHAILHLRSTMEASCVCFAHVSLCFSLQAPSTLQEGPPSLSLPMATGARRPL